MKALDYWAMTPENRAALRGPVWRWGQVWVGPAGSDASGASAEPSVPGRLTSSAFRPCGAKDNAGSGTGSSPLQRLRGPGHQPDGPKVNSEEQAAQRRVLRSRYRFWEAVFPNLKTEIIMVQAVPCVCFSTPAYPLTHCLDLKSNTIDMRPGTPQKKPELLGKNNCGYYKDTVL